jgi:murein DD-endopeptidase MepM/ murein hydrolase activator NlpD
MKRTKWTIKLYFEDPVKAEITKRGGEWGAPRPYGRHIGIDYKATWRSHVKASEDGIVVKSEDKKGSVDKGSYGETIVIDHTPEAGDEQRHIYTLYAHLHKRLVSVGNKVYKGKTTIGESGNTGMKEYYRGLAKGIKVVKQGGHHLHFEVIDYAKKLDWSGGNWPSGHRKKPGGYLDQTTTIEYELTEEEVRKIIERMDVDLHMDFERNSWWADVLLGNKKVGRIDQHNSAIRLSFSQEELERMLKLPPAQREKQSKGMVYEINIE